MLKQFPCKLILCFVVSVLLMCLETSNALALDKVIDQEKLNKAIGLNIEKYMPWDKGSMRYEILSSLPEIAMPAGNVSWKVEIKGNNNNYLGNVYFTLKLYNNGVLFKEESIRVRIEVLREFVVSVKNLGRECIIGADDVSLQKKWVRSIPLNSISNKDDVVGKLLCVSVRQNTEISRNMLKEVTAVKRNKIVQIVLDNGAINITTTGVAEEDGAEGSFVKVRNISSNKIIYARVVGESKVEVDFK